MPPRLPSDPGPSQGWSLIAQEQAGGVLITASGELDVAAVPQLRQAIRSAANSLPAPARVVVDLSGVTFLDATVLGVLVSERQTLQRGGGDLVLIGVTAWSIRIIEICGLRETLGL